MNQTRLKIAVVLFVVLMGFAGCGKLKDAANIKGSGKGKATEGDRIADQAQAAEKNGKWAEARDLYQKALKHDFRQYEKATILSSLGHCWLELDDAEKAVKYHKEALELNGQSPQIWTHLGIAYRRMDRMKDAEEAYQNAIKYDPNYAEAYASLGVVQIFTGRAEEAVKSLEKAIKLDSQLAVSHSNLSVAYASVGRFNDAEASLKRAALLGYPAHKVTVIRKRIDALKKAKN